MPELNNIQTFEKIKALNIKPTLNRFCNVIKRIELWNETLEQEFVNFNWNNDGYIYNNFMSLDFYLSKFYEIKIRPHFMIYTKNLDKTFNDNWASCEFLIASSDLRSQTDGLYYDHTLEIVKKISLEMSKEFNQTGIYFTDEAQDASDFDGVRCRDKAKLWEFDYALIPISLKSLYSEIPSTHISEIKSDFIESYYHNRWKKPSR